MSMSLRHRQPDYNNQFKFSQQRGNEVEQQYTDIRTECPLRPYCTSCSTDLLEKPFDKLLLPHVCSETSIPTQVGLWRCDGAMKQRCCPINNPSLYLATIRACGVFRIAGAFRIVMF